MEKATYLKTESDLQGLSIEGVPRIKNVTQITERPSALPGLSATAEIQYTKRFWGNAFNTFRIPATTLVNLRASYDVRLAHQLVTLRAEVDNIANTHFWGYLASSYFFVGQPRTVMLHASIKL